MENAMRNSNNLGTSSEGEKEEEIKHSTNRFVDFYFRNKNLVLALVIPLLASLIPIIWQSEV
jgi:hypothetical protein